MQRVPAETWPLNDKIYYIINRGGSFFYCKLLPPWYVWIPAGHLTILEGMVEMASWISPSLSLCAFLMVTFCYSCLNLSYNGTVCGLICYVGCYSRCRWFGSRPDALHADVTRPFRVRWNHFCDILITSLLSFVTSNRWHQIRQFIVCYRLA